MIDHKWADARGWGGAVSGTQQCDRCNRVASPMNPKVNEILASPCGAPSAS